MLVARQLRTRWCPLVLSVVLGLAIGLFAAAPLAPSASAGKSVIVSTSTTTTTPVTSPPPSSDETTELPSTASQTISVEVPCAVPRLQHCWPVTDTTVPGAGVPGAGETP